MFIYIKNDVCEPQHRYVINKVSLQSGEYFEIAFKKHPSPTLISRAVSHCGKGSFPIVYDGALKRREQKRRFNTHKYDTLLLINGFSEVCRGLDKALFIDPYGEFCEQIFMPICAIKTLYVLSPFKDLYADAANYSLKTFGAGALILENKVPLHDFPAVLSPRGISEIYGNASHPFLFGEGGYMPAGDRVVVHRRHFDKNLQAALYCCLKDKKSATAAPEFFTKNGVLISSNSLKLRLDRSLSGGI